MLSFRMNENYDEQKNSMIEKIESRERNCDIKHVLPFKLSRKINEILLKIASFIDTHIV